MAARKIASRLSATAARGGDDRERAERISAASAKSPWRLKFYRTDRLNESSLSHAPKRSRERIERRSGALMRNATSVIGVRRRLFLVFGEAVLGGHVVGVQRHVERTAAHDEFMLRVGDFNAGLFEESPDAIVDVALDLRVAARAFRIDEQAEVEREIAEADELHGRFRIGQNVLHAFSRAQQRLCDQFGIAIRG